MKKFYLFPGAFLSLVFFISCSKKNIPSKSKTSTVEYSRDSSAVVKEIEEEKAPAPPPKKNQT